MVTGEELIQRKVLLPAERENIGVNVQVENIYNARKFKNFQEIMHVEKWIIELKTGVCVVFLCGKFDDSPVLLFCQ